MEWQNYRSGGLIFQEGEQSDAAYLIISGNVRIVKGHNTSNPKELAVVGAGEYVGEMGAIDNLPRSASAVAQGTVVCTPVTPADFMDMLQKKTGRSDRSAEDPIRATPRCKQTIGRDRAGRRGLTAPSAGRQAC